MRKALLTTEKNFYKANLHCHSTYSDGGLTPEEIKEAYMAHGYSIVAYTDHDILLPHTELNDADFLALHGFEMEFDEAGHQDDYSLKHTCHVCFIARKQDQLIQPCYHRSDYLFGNAPKYRHLIQYDETKPDFVREYTPEGVSRAMREGREQGFFVTYNHPVWSMETLEQYGNYHGMHAMEICNFGCFHAGYAEYNERIYDEILCGGEKIYGICADDNHSKDLADCFGAFTVINADRLEYETVTEAMMNGEFYASQGPSIYELWYEDGRIGITCSPAASVILHTGRRRREVVYAEGEKGVTEAVFQAEEKDLYVRVTVTDFSGNHANTNACFIRDLVR